MENWKNSFKLKEQLTLSESYEQFPYVDTVGKITIGIGHNLSDRGLSQRIIDMIYYEDIEATEFDLDQNLPWWRQLNETRQLVLMDMCFNLGITRLLGFTHTLAAIEQGLYKEASIQMLKSKWAHQVKGRANKLARMMEYGV
jgi:lysozyme